MHYGHKVGTVNNNMKWALYGERLGVCLFDLDITKKYLVRYLEHILGSKNLIFSFRALNFVAHVAMRGGMIMFVTSNRDTMFDVEKAAEEVSGRVVVGANRKRGEVVRHLATAMM